MSGLILFYNNTAWNAMQCVQSVVLGAGKQCSRSTATSVFGFDMIFWFQDLLLKVKLFCKELGIK
jgi:hypothetical protein